MHEDFEETTDDRTEECASEDLVDHALDKDYTVHKITRRAHLYA